MEFEELLSIPPLPVPAAAAGAQAVAWAAQIEAAGGVDAAREQAVDRILAAESTDPPTESGRLHLLYRDAYTRDEVAGLVTATLVSLGVVPRG